ncbi:hypothetical protein DWZ56_04955 [Lachnotalea sp. AF33-28]|nr:hypothetical protein DWZ56_04955 [Lachnotalea sp. AF33-28]
MFNGKIRPIGQKTLRLGSHCGGKVVCRQGDPPQAENPASGIHFHNGLRFINGSRKSGREGPYDKGILITVKRFRQ